MRTGSRKQRKEILEELRRMGLLETQERFVDISRELFGERGAQTQEEWDQIIAEGHARGVKGAPYTVERLTDGLKELPDPRESRP